jgi:trans-aconitate 2-methyltransferase
MNAFFVTLFDANEDLCSLEKFDIVFSNVAIQWMPGHKELLQKFIGKLNDNVVLAIQVPNPAYMIIREAIHKTAGEDVWIDFHKL